MQFIFGYAGIPYEIYDSIYDQKDSLTGGKNTEFIGKSLTKSEPILNSVHARYFLNKFKENVERNYGSPVSTTGFAVIYVRSDQMCADSFEEAFFPSTLVFSVNWQLTGRRKNEINHSKIELFNLLLQATIRARLAIEALHKELIECANRTPLLLPLKNFRSKTLRFKIQELQKTLADPSNQEAAAIVIKNTVERLRNDHPPVKIGTQKRPCFLDDSEVEFHSPGSVFHGLPRSSVGHPIGCLLGGYRRLGAPFNPAFHYDCKKEKSRKLKDSFYSCHEEPKIFEGNPHINIAPNDFVRI